MMTYHHYTRCLYIRQRWKSRVLRTRGGLTPYLKLGGCAAVLLIFTLTLAAPSLGHAAVTTNLRFLAPVLGARTLDAPARLPLPRQVIAATAFDFADVRIFDDEGLETP